MGFASLKKSVETCISMKCVASKIALPKDASTDTQSLADTITGSVHASMAESVSIVMIPQ